ncbi:MAG: ribose 5-phosphate isomerase B [Candidatus Portnoybacteria bacterium CG10_big_fil_rev_8_21_14_0_10_44_7]|uniref:Ribose 5-phosphate isomerase B n=1 Tax=Candidatus Portnoybacteria bacterium CG10_big_fil_rev_8_21_14_0_10_44_7 TaxID=1974816 RepID=A0A2M8KI85_9BACT|nr:MAG: ribose 5-phosphate isomerase B [Candidatus Portnoybacteria bacterium CG10_big_fil_rev_8_21_14_0_10_44_7]
MTVLYIAADHAGWQLKEDLREYLLGRGEEVLDLGNDVLDPDDDYPDFARDLAEKVVAQGARGILVCGSGQGVCLAANKVKGVRAALAHDEFTARTAREHLDANILCLGGRVTDLETAKKIVKNWLGANFEEAPRHERRLSKIKEIEKEN